MNTDEIYIHLYDKLDTAFPEFEFKMTAKGWQSSNVTKIDGREGKKPGQVLCTTKKPTLLADFSDSMYWSFWEYVQKRYNLDNGQTFLKLAELAGVELPKKQLTAEQKEAYRIKAKAAKIWEVFNDYCKDQLLQHTDSHLKAYLTQQRSYTMADVEAMELGQLTDWKHATDYIKAHSNYSNDEINEAIQCKREAIGHSHKLIIPIRNTAGQIEGIIARNVNHTKEDKLPKYLFSTGLKKGSLLYGLPYRPKDGTVVLVEGQLDAAIANARSYPTGAVAAIGGKSITTDQVQCLLKTKTRKVILCLDNEPATKPDIRRAIELIQQQDEDEQIGDRVYIATLPEGIKDADELITQQGIEAFTHATTHAISYQHYLAQDAIDRYDTTEQTDSDRTELVDTIVRIAATIKSPALKEDLLQLFVMLLTEKGMPISQAALEDAADRIKLQKDREEQERLTKKLLKDAQKKLDEGDTEEAINLIENKLHQVKQRNVRAEYEGLYNTVLTEDNVYKQLRDKPEGAKTGYSIRYDGDSRELQAPAGQLTFFAAPTNHGKTGLMLNVALNILKTQPYRSVHFFTFEMDAISIMQYALNVYIGETVSADNRGVIRHMFKGNDVTVSGNDEKKKELLYSKKDQFFRELIDTKKLNILYTSYSADELIGYIEYIHKHDKHAVIIVDYVQKLRSEKKANLATRQAELKAICDDLNDCAIRTQFPFIMAAQFKRETFSPLDMHPTALAEASDIEKTASEIYGIWNCTKKLPGKREGGLTKQLDSDYGIKCDGTEELMLLQVLKSREMSTGGYAKLNYHRNSGRIGGAAPPFAMPAAMLNKLIGKAVSEEEDF